MTTESATLGFENLVELYYKPLFHFAVKLCGTPDAALDLTQQAFYQALRRFGQLRERGRFKSWLFSILFREFLQRRRHDTKFRHQNLEHCEPELPSIAPDEASRLDAKTARAALDDLPELFRAPLSLFYLRELSYREIAQELSIPVGTVMSRISRGKQLLRERLEPNV
ncbi:MAG TPA: RNA polymerase sigma factor [Verrucomicrobiae bacterium]|nr:RNA polymerase sigma factor [Verrucomicrobiae bacterium]